VIYGDQHNRGVIYVNDLLDLEACVLLEGCEELAEVSTDLVASAEGPAANVRRRNDQLNVLGVMRDRTFEIPFVRRDVVVAHYINILLQATLPGRYVGGPMTPPSLPLA
jgi:hypothetical protein